MSDKFPLPAYSDGIRKSTQTTFRGLNHNPAAGDGQIYAMKNLCSDYFPALATRAKRMRLAPEEAWGEEHIIWNLPIGMHAGNKLMWIDREEIYYDGTKSAYILDPDADLNSKRKLVAFNGKIIILPDMAEYDPGTDTMTPLGADVTCDCKFMDGTLYGISAEGNTIACEIPVDGIFRPGDALTISGSSVLKNNGTFIVREVEGAYLRFYENTFTTTSTWENLNIAREVPALLFAFEHENRLWGCDGNTIYASKLGDARNWKVYDGLETDSWTVSTNDNAAFTGGCTFGGYATFFKERKICKVYGSAPSNFEVTETESIGVAAGSDRSLAVANGMLFYLSDNGICAYMGGEPSVIGSVFGRQRYKNAVGGSDGLKYYVSMEDTAEYEWHLYVYDTQKGLWHEEDDKQVLNFGYLKGRGNLFFLDKVGDIWATGNYMELNQELRDLRRNYNPREIEPHPGAELREEEDFDWYAEFTDFTDDSPNKKDIRKIQIRLDLEEGAECTVKLQLDSSGEWITPEGGLIEESGKRSYYLAIIPQRADHYRMRIEGHGGCIIYSITREYSIGSELKSMPGRQ